MAVYFTLTSEESEKYCGDDVDLSADHSEVHGWAYRFCEATQAEKIMRRCNVSIDSDPSQIALCGPEIALIDHFFGQ